MSYHKQSGYLILVLLIQSFLTVELVPTETDSFLGVKNVVSPQAHSAWVEKLVSKNQVDLSKYVDIISEVDANAYSPCLLPYNKVYKFG
jgi:hypothetical protein